MEEMRNVVKGIADSLGLLDPDGELLPLDSLMIVDMVVALEDALKVRIPAIYLRPASFSSIDSVTKVLAEL